MTLRQSHWAEFGPGAVGVGWEMGLLGMELRLTRPDEPKVDEQTFHTTPEGKALLTGSSEAWGQAAIAAGTDPETARASPVYDGLLHRRSGGGRMMHVFSPRRSGAATGVPKSSSPTWPSRRGRGVGAIACVRGTFERTVVLVSH